MFQCRVMPSQPGEDRLSVDTTYLWLGKEAEGRMGVSKNILGFFLEFKIYKNVCRLSSSSVAEDGVEWLRFDLIVTKIYGM